MTSETGAGERLRIYVTGDCDGLDALSDALDVRSDR